MSGCSEWNSRGRNPVCRQHSHVARALSPWCVWQGLPAGAEPGTGTGSRRKAADALSLRTPGLAGRSGTQDVRPESAGARHLHAAQALLSCDALRVCSEFHWATSHSERARQVTASLLVSERGKLSGAPAIRPHVAQSPRQGVHCPKGQSHRWPVF